MFVKISPEQIKELETIATERLEESLKRARSLPERLSLAAMNWMQLAIELTREAMKSRAEPAKPTEPTDRGTALSQQFGLIERQMEAIVQNLMAHNAKLERSMRRQRIWNYTWR